MVVGPDPDLINAFFVILQFLHSADQQLRGALGIYSRAEIRSDKDFIVSGRRVEPGPPNPELGSPVYVSCHIVINSVRVVGHRCNCGAQGVPGQESEKKQKEAVLTDNG